MKKIMTSLMALVFAIGISAAAHAQGNVEKPQPPVTKVESTTQKADKVVAKTQKGISGTEKGKIETKSTVEKSQTEAK